MTDATAQLVVDGFLTAYRGNTFLNYRTDITRWTRWLDDQQVGLLTTKRIHIDMYRQHLEDCELAPATVARHLTAIASLYRYAEQEEYVSRSPAQHVKRPRVPSESTSAFLDRAEMGAYLIAAENDGSMSHALICLLMLNGLRVAEATGATIEGLGFSKGHRTLDIIGKGSKPATVPLAPRTARVVLRAIGERTAGPILLNRDGAPMNRHNASRITRRIASHAGIDKKIGPHSLRHSYATAMLDAGVSMRDAQTAMRHSDARSTVRYDRSRFNLDRHANYVVAAFVAGGT